jgi:hypothetical protein
VDSCLPQNTQNQKKKKKRFRIPFFNLSAIFIFSGQEEGKNTWVICALRGNGYISCFYFIA